MQAIQSYLFRVQDYPEVLARQRAKGLFIINWIQLSFFTLGLVMVATRWITSGVLPPIELRIVYAIFFVCTIFIHVSIQNQRSQVAAFALVSELTFAFMYYLPFWEGISTFRSILLFLPIIAIGTLIQSRSLRIWMGVVLAGIVIVAGLSQANSADFELRAVSSTHTFVLLVVGGSAWGILEVFRVSEIYQISSYIDQTNETLLWFTNDKDEDYTRFSEVEILDASLRKIQGRFGADYVTAYLTNSKGIIDRRILNDPRVTPQVESISLRQNSVLYQSIQKTEPITIQRNSSHQHHLSDRATTAILFPMTANDQPIGVLDIQFLRNPMMTVVEKHTMRAFAARLADILSKSRYLAHIKEHLNEQELMANRLKSQVHTLQTRRRDNISTFWDEYVEKTSEKAFGFDINNKRIIPANEISESMKVALDNGEIYVAIDGDAKILNVPIQVRERVLGALAFTVPLDKDLSDRQIDTVKTITNRLGTALENVRLLEQTQAQATRERKAGESASVLIAATDINSLIQIAADNFNETLGAVQTRIYLEPDVNRSTQIQRPAGLNGHSLSNGSKSENGG